MSNTKGAAITTRDPSRLVSHAANGMENGATPTEPALPARWTIITYVCAGAPANLRAVAHLFEKRDCGLNRDNFSLQSATAFGRTCDEARASLSAFLQAEITSESKRQANAKAFGERVRLRSRRSA